MRVTSNEKLEDYQVIGNKLRLHWGHEQVTVEDMEGEQSTQWQCEEAVVKKTANRDEIIEAIIGSKYKVTEELAVINNGGEEYTAYQSFRQFAKDTADKWLNK